MSKLKQILEIQQPDGMLFHNHGESFKSAVQECATCNGSGGKYIDSRSPDYNADKGEHYKPCAVCEGSGMVIADIVVRWRQWGEVQTRFKKAEK